jgi:hypothetical protein
VADEHAVGANALYEVANLCLKGIIRQVLAHADCTLSCCSSLAGPIIAAKYRPSESREVYA